MTEERHIPDDAIAPIESKKTFRAFPSILSLFASALLALPALADITLNVTASRPSISMSWKAIWKPRLSRGISSDRPRVRLSGS